MPHIAIVKPIPPPAEVLASVMGINQKELLEKIQKIADSRRKKT